MRLIAHDDQTVGIGCVEVDVGDIDTDVDISLDDIIENMDDEDFTYINENFKSNYYNFGNKLKVISAADICKIDLLEKIYNKFTLTELEEIFKDKI